MITVPSITLPESLSLMIRMIQKYKMCENVKVGNVLIISFTKPCAPIAFKAFNL